MNLPNLLTVARMVLAPVLLALLHVGSLAADGAALVLLAVAGATDLLDGHLARARGQTSIFGKLADPLSDSFVFLALFGGFAAAGWMPGWLFALFLGRETFMHGFLRPYFLWHGIALGAKRAGKLKTLVQSVVGFAVLGVIAATRSWGLPAADVPARVRLPVFWALVVTAAASVASLHAYVAELWRRREQRPGQPA